MNKRTYNKLFVNRNREEGSDKLSLGYMLDSKEMVFPKDQITEFNIPYYSNPPTPISKSLLIANGATGGPIPAASDRIFKSKKNYGEHTWHGTPSDTADGTWFCSWLFKNPEGTSYWLDRFYNPGATVTVTGLLTGAYVAHNPVYRDIPSTLNLESGVRYKYFHCGEKTASQFVGEFSGPSSERLLLDLSNWSDDTAVDTSPNAIVPKIVKQNANTSIFEMYESKTHTSKQTLVFNPATPISVTVDYNPTYAPTDEFTVSFWSKSSRWQDIPTTQLLGNYSSNGGWGIFVQNLSSYPFFVIPETNYGHLLYVNEGLNGYLDQSVQEIPKIPTAAAHVAVDFNQHAVVCMEDNSGLIYKLDNSGKIIAHSKNTASPFNYAFFDEVPIQVLIGKDNDVVIRTDRMIYTLDEQLNRKTQQYIASTSSDTMAFKWDPSLDFYELHIAKNAIDSKFTETTQWLISADGNLYKKLESDAVPLLFYVYPNKATNLSIDPFDRVWVMHDNNLISVFDSTAAPLDLPLFSLAVGENISHPNKNINFFCQYNAETKERTWLCAVYYSNENFIHIINMDGSEIKVIDIFSLFNGSLVQALEQTSDKFKFFGKGDFTGYEHKRVFKNLSPYSNENQIVLKLALKETFSKTLTFSHLFAKSSLASWKNDTWQHVLVTLKHQTFNVYVNSKKVISFPFSGKNKLSYELAPLLYVGSSAGSQSGFNKELQYTSESFEGSFAEIKVYNYAIEEKFHEMFLREFYKADDVIWNAPTPNLQYVEKIERLFKNKIPGHKTGLYRVKLKGSKIKDQKLKVLIEELIKQTASEINPAYVEFLTVEWVD